MEPAPFGIRVDSLHPGAIDTPMTDVWTGPGAPLAPAQMEAMSPLNRLGTSEEVAWAALFLLPARRGARHRRQDDCQTCFICEAHCPADALYVALLGMAESSMTSARRS